MKKEKEQHTDFARGPPPHYYPCQNVLDFADQTGCGILTIVWPFVHVKKFIDIIWEKIDALASFLKNAKPVWTDKLESKKKKKRAELEQNVLHVKMTRVAVSSFTIVLTLMDIC